MRARLSRRSLLGRGLAAAAGAALVACGGAAPPTEPARPSAPATAASPAPTVASAGAAAAPTAAPAATVAAQSAAPATAVQSAAPATAVQSAAPAATAAAARAAVTVRLHMRAGGDKSEPAIYVDRPGEWEQETGNKVKLEPIPGGNDYVAKIMALAAGGTIGDAAFTTDSNSEHTFMARNNIIEPVDDYLTRSAVKKTEWQKPIVDQMTTNGRLYGLPKGGHPGDSFVWINLSMFDKAGIKRPPVYGNTYDQLAEWAIKLSQGPKDRRQVYGYFSSVVDRLAVADGVRAMGGDVVAPDGVTSLADTDPWWSWASWNARLIVDEQVHPTGNQLSSGGVPEMFAAEKVAMFHGARSLHYPMKLQVKDKFEWTTIQLPRQPNARGWVVGLDTHSGMRASKLKDETFSLIYAMADRRFAYLVAKTQGYLTGRVDNMEAIKELADDPFIQLQARCAEQEEQLWRAKNLRAAEVITEINNKMDEIWLAKRKLDRPFLGELKKSVDAILAKPDA